MDQGLEITTAPSGTIWHGPTPESAPVAAQPDLASYDIILANSSAGKDSQAMLDYLAERCRALGILDRLVVVHADLGRVEWRGTAELAEEHARHYGLRFFKVRREQGDLLHQVEQRGKWPGPKTRYCTSDHKRGQVQRVMTALVQEFRHRGVRRPVRILNCMGHRAEESPKRAKMRPLEHEKRASNGRRHVDTWRPLHAWTEPQVWARIRQAGTRAHWAYSIGMPRLSCCFCIYAPREALILAGHHNRELLSEYVRVERKIGHDFKHRLPIASIQAAVERGEQGAPIQSWCM